MTPKQLFQKDAVAVSRAASLFEADLFSEQLLNVAFAEYSSRLRAENANDALLLSGKLAGAIGVLEELRTLHKKYEPPVKPLSAQPLDYAANKHTPIPAPSSPRSGGTVSTRERSPLNPP